MSKIPSDIHYTKSHEWVRKRADGTLELGITDHAQEALGDLVFIDVPAVGRELAAGEACAVVESVKAASDIYCPVAAVVTEGNAALADTPELVNQDPYGAGWILRAKPADAAGLGALMDAAAYAKHLESEAH